MSLSSLRGPRTLKAASATMKAISDSTTKKQSPIKWASEALIPAAPSIKETIKAALIAEVKASQETVLIAEVETAQEATKSQSDPAKDQVAPKGVSALPVAPVITRSHSMVIHSPMRFHELVGSQIPGGVAAPLMRSPAYKRMSLTPGSPPLHELPATWYALLEGQKMDGFVIPSDHLFEALGRNKIWSPKFALSLVGQPEVAAPGRFFFGKQVTIKVKQSSYPGGVLLLEFIRSNKRMSMMLIVNRGGVFYYKECSSPTHGNLTRTYATWKKEILDYGRKYGHKASAAMRVDIKGNDLWYHSCQEWTGTSIIAHQTHFSKGGVRNLHPGAFRYKVSSHKQPVRPALKKLTKSVKVAKPGKVATPAKVSKPKSPSAWILAPKVGKAVQAAKRVKFAEARRALNKELESLSRAVDRAMVKAAKL